MGSSWVCRSRVVQVSVYARGALVTREVELPSDLGEDRAELVVVDITPLAPSASFQVRLEGGREVAPLELSWNRPAAAPPPPETREEVQATQRKITQLERQIGLIGNQRAPLLAGAPQRFTRPGGHFSAVEVESENILAVGDLVQRVVSQLDRQLQALNQQLEDTKKVLLDQRQGVANQATTWQGCVPSRQVHIHLLPGPRPTRLTLSYTVETARWWPTYQLDLRDNGGQGEWVVKAWVAQSSLEDWNECQISVCSGDLLANLRLPELRTLKLGRALPPRARPLRPPPPGPELLFEGFDVGVRTLLPSPVPPPPPPMVRRPPPPRPQPKLADDVMESDVGAEHEDEGGTSFELGRGAAPEGAARKMRMPGGRMNREAAPQVARSGGPPPAMMMADFAAAPMSVQGGGGPQSPPPPPEEVLGEHWLDFGSLRMAPPGAPRLRGSLHPAEDKPPPEVDLLKDGFGATRTPAGCFDPRDNASTFQSLWVAAVPQEVRSGQSPTSVVLARSQVACVSSLRCAPRMGSEVYRQVELTNPFPQGLLPGPVEVFMDGDLLTTTPLTEVAPGGSLRVGLGLEERIRVARNTRVEESSRWLGHTLDIDHEVTIDLASRLGFGVTVLVYDRLPVSEDKDVEVKLIKSEPESVGWTQPEGPSPLRGGLSWSIPLAGGASGRVVFKYRVSLPAKNELAGGNRRE